MPTLSKQQIKLLKVVQSGGKEKELLVMNEIFDLEEQLLKLKDQLDNSTASSLKKTIDEAKKDADKAFQLVGAFASQERLKGDKGEEGDKGEVGPVGPDGKVGETGATGEQGLTGEVGPAGKDGAQGDKGEDGIDGSPDTGEEIVEKINELPTDKDELLIDIEHIDGWKELVKDLRARIVASKRVMTPKKVHTPMVDQFQSSTDGANKAFTLSKAPNNVATMKAWGSDFPHIMTNGFGFTVAGKVVTIDSDVDAPSTNSYFVVEYYT